MKRLTKNTSRSGVRIAIVAAIVAALAGLAMIPAQASTNGPNIVEDYQGPGYVFVPENWSPRPAFGGLVERDAVRVTVALQNKANGLWWQPNDSCSPSNFPTCGDGVLGKKWEKNDAMLLDGIINGPLTYSFELLPPEGTYMVGIKAYDEYGNTGRSIWQEVTFKSDDAQPVIADLAPPLPANTYNEGRVVLTGGVPSSDTNTVVGVYNRDLGRWVDPSGNALSAKERFPAEFGGDDFFGFTWDLALDLPPGRYAYGADTYDSNGVRVGGSAWTYFTVRDCSVRCANVSLTDARVTFEDAGVCFGVGAEAADVRLALRNSDGEWLTGSPLTFGQSWGQFNNLSTLIQAGEGSYNSCYNDAPLALPAGDYNLGVKTYDSEGTEGPKAWFGFTVR